MILIEREPLYLFKERGGYEPCEFCKNPTVYWHKNTNNPVCPSCAKNHTVNELTDHGQI